jgi:hypothetical protein
MLRPNNAGLRPHQWCQVAGLARLRVNPQHFVPELDSFIAFSSGLWPGTAIICSFTPSEARVPTVQAQIHDCDEFLLEVRERLE